MKTASKKLSVPVHQPAILYDFSDETHLSLWHPVNDVVMGGMSSGCMKRGSRSSALFSGTVSFEQGGGFASVRSHSRAHDLSAFCGIALEVKGDGKVYKFNITDGEDQSDVLHQARFETVREKWMMIELPFESFRGAFRGKPVNDHPPLDTSRVRTCGLMISDGQQGEFALEVSKIIALT